MKVYNITPIQFTASTPKAKTKKAEQEFTKESFFNQIEGYMDKKYSTEKYMKVFSEGVAKIIKQEKLSEYTPVERNYINNMISVLDSSEDLSKIPEDYLRENMLEVLKQRKQGITKYQKVLH